MSVRHIADTFDFGWLPRGGTVDFAPVNLEEACKLARGGSAMLWAHTPGAMVRTAEDDIPQDVVSVVHSPTIADMAALQLGLRLTTGTSPPRLREGDDLLVIRLHTDLTLRWYHAVITRGGPIA